MREQVETFERRTLFGMRYFFRIVDRDNHEVLAPSQTYKTQSQRDITALRLATKLGCPLVKGKPR